jgi:hypothetical protein
MLILLSDQRALEQTPTGIMIIAISQGGDTPILKTGMVSIAYDNKVHKTKTIQWTIQYTRQKQYNGH